MNLLKSGIETKAIIETELTKKLTIGNITKTYPVYKIRLDQLYYNDQNDRVVTWVSKYISDNNITEMDASNLVEYNNLVHQFITESNKEALKQTEKNIELVGQQECGVVLSDGRIIDGNRRFTCLRNIENKAETTQYFEAVILDYSIENNAKQIKMLELMLQHGVDEKVDYSPADRLVGIYNDIVEKQLLSIKEYAKSVNQTEAWVKVEVEKAKLMAEFLEFLNAPKQYHLTRTMNLTDPFKDLYSLLKKVRSDEKRSDLKNTIFAQLVMTPTGDMTRHIRKIEKIVSSTAILDGFLNEQEEMTGQVCDRIEEHPSITPESISEIKSDEKLKKEFYNSTEKWVAKADSHATRNQPLVQLEKVHSILGEVDSNIFQKLEVEQKDDIKNKITMIEEILSDIKDYLNV